MIGRETRMLLRHYLEQGGSKSALARALGVSRDTVHRWIRAGDLDRDLDTTPVQYGPRRPVPTKLDAYKAGSGVFFGPTIGFLFALANDQGIQANLNVMFPDVAFEPSVGYVFGL